MACQYCIIVYFYCLAHILPFSATSEMT